MHKAVILLVKAEDRDDAIEEANSFLESYGDGDVWDWYIIGGRWSGTLNPNHNTFHEKAMAHFKSVYHDHADGWLSHEMISEQKVALQEIWAQLGEKTDNPFNRDQYSKNVQPDDCLPLIECVSTVKEWEKDTEKEAEEMFQKMLTTREEEKANSSGTMSAYYAGKYKELKYDNFSFESNVYNTVNGTNDPTEAIAAPEGWWAVMVDMHN